MATPKKTIKVRDREQTRRDLLNAVGEILRTCGYTGLRVNKIARHIGKDKSAIRHHFGRLVDLEKAYIREKDYWPPFFEQFQLPDSPSKKEVKDMFTRLMQQNLLSFWDNPEMQQIILWQISEENPLMRSISEARERNGAMLLSKAGPFFAGSGPNFKAVIALLLGGIYYMVLHAEKNKSTVCGLDLNLEGDRQTVIKTIGEIIGWAFEAGSGESG